MREDLNKDELSGESPPWLCNVGQWTVCYDNPAIRPDLYSGDVSARSVLLTNSLY